MKPNRPLAAAALLSGLGVILGAFGAHGLKGAGVSDADIEIWKTGTHYHLLHAAMLCVLAFVDIEGKYLWVRRLWWIGIAIFAGSLYLLVLLKQRWMGAITPLGGLSLIAGWFLLAIKAVKA